MILESFSAWLPHNGKASARFVCILPVVGYCAPRDRKPWLNEIRLADSMKSIKLPDPMKLINLILGYVILTGCMSMSESVVAGSKSREIPLPVFPVEVVDLYKMKESPSGSLKLKVSLKGPRTESTDLLEFHPSGDYLLSGGKIRTNLRVWDLNKGNSVKSLEKSKRAEYVKFSPDGKHLFVDYYRKDDDKTSYQALYDTENYEISHLDPTVGRPSVASFNQQTNDLYLLRRRRPQSTREYPDVSRYVVDSGFQSAGESGMTIHNFSDALAWGPDGKSFVVGDTDLGQPGSGDEARFIGIWDSQTLKEIRRIENIYDEPNAFIIAIKSLAWSPDGQYFVIGPEGSSRRGTRNRFTGEMMVFDYTKVPIQIRQAETGKLLYEVMGHRPGFAVSHIEFLTNDIFITLEESSIQGAHMAIWSVSTGNMLEAFKLPKVNGWPAITWNKKQKLLAVSFARLIQVYEFNEQLLMSGENEGQVLPFALFPVFNIQVHHLTK